MPNALSSELRGLLVTGTDTGVGKTHISALILTQLREAGVSIGAYKPACTGAIQQSDDTWRWEDVERLADAMDWRASTCKPDVSSNAPTRAATPGGERLEAFGDTSGLRVDACLLDLICPQRFLAPLAPPMAARAEGRAVDAQKLVNGVTAWRGRVHGVIIEGVGGWLCPVSDDWTIADLASSWQVPVLIVARRGLGTINHTLLTVESIRQRNLPIAGIVLNEPEPLIDDPSVEENATEIERRTGIPILGELAHAECNQLRRAGKPVRISWWELMGIVRS